MDPIDPPLPSGTKICIVKPDVGLSTPSVFKALEYDKLSTIDPDETLLPTFLKSKNLLQFENRHEIDLLRLYLLIYGCIAVSRIRLKFLMHYGV